MATASEAGAANTKTHRRLRKSYCRLLKENKKDKITVSSLTEEADVSRATFYLYYQNIDEFTDDTEKYIIALFINQIRMFLEAGKEEAKQACKRKNLIFTNDDFDLFCSLFSESRGFGFDHKVFEFFFQNFAEKIPDFFDNRFVKNNKARFDLFYIGYAGVMRENFINYNSDKVYRDILRSIEMWDFLFPEHKYKN